MVAAVGLEDGTGGSDRLSGIYKWFNLRPPIPSSLTLRIGLETRELTVDRRKNEGPPIPDKLLDGESCPAV